MPQLSLHTPVGDLTISEEDGAVVAIDWGWGRDQGSSPTLLRARKQLHEYFDGQRTDFDVQLAPAGSAYRKRVWRCLSDIPYGGVRSYREIAAVAGGSARSVGGANGHNPIPILIPCHRVLASNGADGYTIGGYSGGDGLDTKRYLLRLEAASVPLSLTATL